MLLGELVLNIRYNFWYNKVTLFSGCFARWKATHDLWSWTPRYTIIQFMFSGLLCLMNMFILFVLYGYLLLMYLFLSLPNHFILSSYFCWWLIDYGFLTCHEPPNESNKSYTYMIKNTQSLRWLNDISDFIDQEFS